MFVFARGLRGLGLGLCSCLSFSRLVCDAVLSPIADTPVELNPVFDLGGVGWHIWIGVCDPFPLPPDFSLAGLYAFPDERSFTVLETNVSVKL